MRRATSTWLANNAGRFGFKRTVPSENWHYEFTGKDPGGPCSAGAKESQDLRFTAPLDEGAFDWTSNTVVPAQRITEKDHWFRADVTTRLENDPVDNRAAPNVHAAESSNILTSTFDAVFFNQSTNQEELYNLDGQIAFSKKNPGKDLDPRNCNHPNKTVVVMPSGVHGTQGEGAIEIKLAWKILTAKDIADRYLVVEALVPASITVTDRTLAGDSAFATNFAGSSS